MTPEGRVKAKLKRALDAAFPGHYRFMPVQSGYGAKTLDFLLCIRGLFIAIETKAPGKSMTPLQHSTYKDIYDAGGLAFVVDGEETIDAVIANIILAVEFRSGRHRSTEIETSLQAKDPGRDHGAPGEPPTR